MPQSWGVRSIHVALLPTWSIMGLKGEIMRRILLFLLLLCIAAPVAAQANPAWSVWLDTQQGIYLRIFSDGHTRMTSLKLPDGYTLASVLLPSDSGDLFALCANVDGEYHALIYDTISD